MKVTDSEVAKLVEAFDRYAETGETGLIDSYSLDLLQHVLIRNSHSAGRPYYVAIEARVKELYDRKTEAETHRDRRKDLLLGAVVGILVTLISQWLWFLITGSK